METRCCVVCGETKPIIEFNKSKYGYIHKCKLCVKKYNKEYNEKNKVRLSLQRLEYKLEHKEEIKKRHAALNYPPDLTILEKVCSKCGEIKSIANFGKSTKQKDGYNKQCKDCLLIRNSAYQKEHPEVGRKAARKYYRIHKEEISIKLMLVYRTVVGRNKAIVAAHNRRYAGGIPLTKEVVSEVVNAANGVCIYCGKQITKGHLDHVIPISKGGTNAKENLVWVCARCNLSKGDRDLEEFLLSRTET